MLLLRKYTTIIKSFKNFFFVFFTFMNSSFNESIKYTDRE